MINYTYLIFVYYVPIYGTTIDMYNYMRTDIVKNISHFL